MKVLIGLLALVALTTFSYATHQPPDCPDRIPGVALNLTFYPNEDDCSKYWECDNGNLYNGSCSDGLVWNPNVESCDWPYNYECPYEGEEIDLRPAIPGSIDQIVCPPPDPTGHSNVTFFPNDGDCHKYWECDNGVLIEGDCGDTLVWNPEVNSCDWVYNYPCFSTTEAPPVTTAAPHSEPQPTAVPTTAAPHPEPEPTTQTIADTTYGAPQTPIISVVPAKPIISLLPAKPRVRVLRANRGAAYRP